MPGNTNPSRRMLVKVPESPVLLVPQQLCEDSENLLHYFSTVHREPSPSDTESIIWSSSPVSTLYDALWRNAAASSGQGSRTCNHLFVDVLTCLVNDSVHSKHLGQTVDSIYQTEIISGNLDGRAPGAQCNSE